MKYNQDKVLRPIIVKVIKGGCHVIIIHSEMVEGFLFFHRFSWPSTLLKCASAFYIVIIYLEQIMILITVVMYFTSYK